jgi:signal transduction histidine kinase
VLATNMNAILDKMEKLFQGIRQVSDNIAHDLRSPLTRLRADVEVTLQESDPKQYRLTLERVLVELQNMQEIFQSLLSLGQAEAGSLKIRKKLLNLAQLLEDIIELYGPLAEDKGLVFDARIAPDLAIEGDRQLLAQALSNLLDNAVKYVPEGGKIVLTAEMHGDKAEIHLDDSGPGIPPEMRKKVFDRFVRVDPSRTLPGTGLGLSLVKAFIELHQGNITLSDSTLGGTSFIIVLPVK